MKRERLESRARSARAHFSLNKNGLLSLFDALEMAHKGPDCNRGKLLPVKKTIARCSKAPWRSQMRTDLDFQNNPKDTEMLLKRKSETSRLYPIHSSALFVGLSGGQNQASMKPGNCSYSDQKRM